MSVTDQKIQEEIAQYVRTELAEDPSLDLYPDVELLMSGIVDSMGAMRLVAFIEKTWDMRIPPQDVTVENFGTIRDISTYVRSHTNGADDSS